MSGLFSVWGRFHFRVGVNLDGVGWNFSRQTEAARFLKFDSRIDVPGSRPGMGRALSGVVCVMRLHPHPVAAAKCFEADLNAD